MRLSLVVCVCVYRYCLGVCLCKWLRNDQCVCVYISSVCLNFHVCVCVLELVVCVCVLPVGVERTAAALHVGRSDTLWISSWIREHRRHVREDVGDPSGRNPRDRHETQINQTSWLFLPLVSLSLSLPVCFPSILLSIDLPIVLPASCSSVLLPRISLLSSSLLISAPHSSLCLLLPRSLPLTLSSVL